MLACALAIRAARADESAPAVVVLRTSAPFEPWVEGTRAVIAELLASGYELRTHSVTVASRAALETQLAAASSDLGAVGAVVVLRRATRGVALVQPRGAAPTQIEVDISEGTVGQSQLALRVVQVLRDVDIPVVDRPALPAPPARSEAIEPERRHRIQLWLSAGALFASDVDRSFPWGALSFALSLSEPLALEASAGAAPIAGRSRTSEGEVELHAQQATLHLMFDPFAEKDYGIALGLGGGAVLMQESARAETGFAGSKDATQVGLLGVRARAFARSGRTSFILLLEPALLFPGVSVRADQREVLRIGRPWIATGLGMGWSL